MQNAKCKIRGTLRVDYNLQKRSFLDYMVKFLL